MNTEEKFDVKNSEKNAKLQEAELDIKELPDDSIENVNGGCSCGFNCGSNEGE